MFAPRVLTHPLKPLPSHIPREMSVRRRNHRRTLAEPILRGRGQDADLVRHRLGPDRHHHEGTPTRRLALHLSTDSLPLHL